MKLAKRRTFHCPFCGKAGHRWISCPKKFATDALAHRIVAAVIDEEIERYFGRVAPPVMIAASRTVMNAYNRAGDRWHLTMKPLLLTGRRKRRAA